MRTIEIEDDIYEHLLRRAEEIGEPASRILRRELGLRTKADVRAGVAPIGRPAVSQRLLSFVGDSSFTQHSTAKDRYLAVLSFLAGQHRESFSKVLGVSGRDRAYFARTREEITKSGRSTEPREIPGTSYWAMTNSPTAQKRDTMRRVLTALGYDAETAREAARAIG